MFQLMVIEDTIKAPPHSFNRDVLEVGRPLTSYCGIIFILPLCYTFMNAHRILRQAKLGLLYARWHSPEAHRVKS